MYNKYMKSNSPEESISCLLGLLFSAFIVVLRPSSSAIVLDYLFMPPKQKQCVRIYLALSKYMGKETAIIRCPLSKKQDRHVKIHGTMFSTLPLQHVKLSCHWSSPSEAGKVCCS